VDFPLRHFSIYPLDSNWRFILGRSGGYRGFQPSLIPQVLQKLSVVLVQAQHSRDTTLVNAAGCVSKGDPHSIRSGAAGTSPIANDPCRTIEIRDDDAITFNSARRVYV
jgi:hypothetical protein